ncbi:MAG: hypothetical protein J5699_01430 [Bacteroidales bacterium]|nr:hypothetical protein [Bacteroidales bacterium]
MKKMIAALAAILILAALPSCSTTWRSVSSRRITDKETVDAILKQHFPDIYKAKEKGSVHVDAVQESVNKKGEIRYKVDYDFHPFHQCD